jgi:hypothetical protein
MTLERCRECARTGATWGGGDPACWLCRGSGYVGSAPAPNVPVYECSVCDGVYAVEPPVTRCIALHHCHTGESFLDAEGRVIAVSGRPDCEPITVCGEPATEDLEQ